MSSSNSAWQDLLSSQTSDDVAHAGGHHYHQQGKGQDLRRIQTYYHEQDYDARGWHGWSNHRSNAYDGTGYYYSEEYDSSYPQQQNYRTRYGLQTYPSLNGGQGYGYSPGAVYSPRSLYDTSSHYQRSAASRVQFDMRDVAPTGDPHSRFPSPSYLSNSLSPSERHERPSRKLLILDLNGTLLLRSNPPCYPPPPPRCPSPRATQDSPQCRVPRAPLPSQPVKRAVYPRPYLPCFREYLFHSSTRSWLDVMIWSSAQPHSVQTMLQKCFPIPDMPHSGNSNASNDDKPDERFIAVWARDTLGLSRFDYSRKTQTTKDLDKPWSQLLFVSGLDNKAVGDSSSPSDLSISEHQVIRHSARTTLLLDDSPRKAYLQPWNHVCLKEYDAAARLRDLKVLRDIPQETQKRPIGGTFDDLHTENSPSIPSPRTKKSPRPIALYQHTFDPTLLAIIGILEAIKHESNVAGWIRENGLWVEGYPDTAKISTSQTDAESGPAYYPVLGTKRPRDDGYDEDTLDSIAKSTRIRRPRLYTSPQPDTKDSTADSLDLSTVASNSSTPLVQISKTDGPLGEMEAKHSSEKDPSNILQHIIDKDGKISPTDTFTSWFSHTPTFAYWVSRGRDALTRLGIDEKHGVSEEEL